MTSSIPNRTVLGWVGLGNMGGALAQRILAADLPLIVYDLAPEQMEPFKGKAELATSAKDVADRADIVFACLTSAKTYQAAVLSKDGIIEGRRARTYVHAGTNEATVVRELEAALAPRGFQVVDAPVTGGVPRAVKGLLTVMTSGSKEAVAKAEPFIKTYASKIVHMGDTCGTAQYMKLVNNMISIGNLAIACEAMVMAHKAGLSLDAAIDVINSGSGQNSATLTKIPNAVLTRAFDHGGGMELAVKDLRAFIVEAAGMGVSTPLCDAIIKSFEQARDEEGPLADLTRVIRPMERAACTQLPEIHTARRPA